MKVLVIDDSKAIYAMVSEMLLDGGHEACWAEDGQKAVDFLKEESVDVVLLDWNMPVMDGPTFLQVNEKEKITEAPVMMMTTENSPEAIKKALSLGAVEYIMKPFSEEIVREKFEETGIL